MDLDDQQSPITSTLTRQVDSDVKRLAAGVSVRQTRNVRRSTNLVKFLTYTRRMFSEQMVESDLHKDMLKIEYFDASIKKFKKQLKGVKNNDSVEKSPEFEMLTEQQNKRDEVYANNLALVQIKNIQTFTEKLVNGDDSMLDNNNINTSACIWFLKGINCPVCFESNVAKSFSKINHCQHVIYMSLVYSH